MQMIPVTPELAVQTMHQVPVPQSRPLSKPTLDPGVGAGAKVYVAAGKRTQGGPFSELDEMLIQDPNTGAIHGLRIALLFNAGLAISGLMVWELWSMLAL